MGEGGGSTFKTVFCCLPVGILLGLFFGLILYVSWNIHIFLPRAPLTDIQCDRMYIKEELAKYLKNKTVLEDDEIYSNNSNGRVHANCRSISRHHYLPVEIPDSMEVQYPLYFIRIVSKDYEFLEEVISMMFSPLHFYCYPISSNASKAFENNLRFLGMCITNIIVPYGTFDMGDDVDRFKAHKACLEHMDGFQWRHLIVNQENEIPLHSIHFIADTMRRLNDISKIGTDAVTEEETRILVEGEKETAKEDLYDLICHWVNDRRDPLYLARAMVPVFYDVAINGANGTEVRKCREKKTPQRIAVYPCPSKKYDENKHCVMGMESLTYAKRSRALFARADPSFDFGIVQCIHQFVFQRTYNMSYYKIRYGNI